MRAVDVTTRVDITSDTSPDQSVDQTALETIFGFNFWLKAKRSSSAVGPILEVYLDAEPEASCSGYQLLVDYQLTVMARGVDEDGESRPCATISVMFELIARGYSKQEESERWTLRMAWKEADDSRCIQESDTKHSCAYCTVRLQLRVKDLLTVHLEHYDQESLPRRDFALIMGHQKQLYVDLQYLSDQGSEYFRDLLESKRKGVRRAVLMNVDSTDMEIFLDAVCTHRKTVITNRNFHIILQLAQELGVDKVLRACESYLIETDSAHRIRKLEYAAEFGLGLLGETVLRELTNGPPLAALDTLHEYMRMNGEDLNDMHPDVLNALNVFDDCVVI